MTTTKNATDQVRTFTDQATEQAEQARTHALSLGKQIAELSFDVSEKAVKQGAELYVKSAEQLPFEGIKELAALQAEFAVKANDMFVRQSRLLWAKS